MTYRIDATANWDRGRHPALFQRVSRTLPPTEEAVPPPAEPAASSAPAFDRDNHRAALRAEAEHIAHPRERAWIQAAITDIDNALYHRRYAEARAIVECRLDNPWPTVAVAEARTQNVGAVLDRLCEDAGGSVIPEPLSRYDGRELQAGTVTVLVNESVRGRLADLCARLAAALETRSDQTWVVVCREFSEEVIVLGLISHITRRMTTAQGLTFEEIQARLSGRDPSDGYGDKPWLVDEAVDRLRRWTDRLEFVADAADAPLTIYTLEKIADAQTLGGVFFDGLPRLWPSAWHAGYSLPAVQLRELAARFSCAVVAVTDQTADAGWAFPTGPRAASERTHEAGRTLREFRQRLLDWIEHEEGQEIRVA